MGYRNRKSWALAGVSLLVLGGVLVTVRGRGYSNPGDLAAETRLVVRNRNGTRRNCFCPGFPSKGLLRGADEDGRVALSL
jgi:hypothetical protein